MSSMRLLKCLKFPLRKTKLKQSFWIYLAFDPICFFFVTKGNAIWTPLSLSRNASLVLTSWSATPTEGWWQQKFGCMFWPPESGFCASDSRCHRHTFSCGQVTAVDHNDSNECEQQRQYILWIPYFSNTLSLSPCVQLFLLLAELSRFEISTANGRIWLVGLSMVIIYKS